MTKNLNNRKSLRTPIILFVIFVAYTTIVAMIDVQPIGPDNSSVGLATINGFFRDTIGIHMLWYDITTILGILSLLIAAFFGVVGVIQLVTRKSLFKIDTDIIVLGCFYVAVLACYVLFDKFAINYRPIILDEGLESSYPSSHTMLAVCIMSTAIMQLEWKMRDRHVSRIVQVSLAILIVIIVVGRMLSGVHWFTDIVGGVILSTVLVSLYYWFVYEAGGPKTHHR